jgi:hypothetical protein
MKGMLNEKGLLGIERAGTTAPQGCPFQPHADDQFPGYGATLCGDWCPHFGEPEADMELGEVDHCMYATGITRLRLCHGTVLVFDKFTDERLQP